MFIEQKIREQTVLALYALYQQVIAAEQLQIQYTKKEFEGHFTLVVFPLTKITGQTPDTLARQLGDYLIAHHPDLEGYNVVKGFLNLVVADSYWKTFLNELSAAANYGHQAPNGERIVLEYCSPNTNKPLHLGHVRNNLLGFSLSRLLAAAGYEVIKTQVINDRGIHICKSIWAWQQFGNGTTPESTGIKGDHFVGDYYVLHEKKFQAEYAEWQTTEPALAFYTEWLNSSGGIKAAKELGNIAEDEKATALRKMFFKEVFKNKYYSEHSFIGASVKQLLVDWENGDTAVHEVWRKMNAWVIAGFEATCRTLGIDFDRNYLESETYLFGKKQIDAGLDSGIFFRKEDGSVVCDLTDAGLDEKVVLRRDGTSLYITQDIGMAPLRYADYKMNRMVYVVADEQDYHFKVLFEILRRLGEPYAEGLHHLSYGMVELPTGRMKSREGTVVDADDLIEELTNAVAGESKQRETLASLPEAEQQVIWRQIALGALKFFILKVEPKRKMIFDPEQSLDFQGQTGPYIQNAYVRLRGIKRKAGEYTGDMMLYPELQPAERELLLMIYQYPELIRSAAQAYSPAEIANYVYQFARTFHKFYDTVAILQAESDASRAFRLQLCEAVGGVLQNATHLLGIELPEKM